MDFLKRESMGAERVERKIHRNSRYNRGFTDKWDNFLKLKVVTKINEYSVNIASHYRLAIDPSQ